MTERVTGNSAMICVLISVMISSIGFGIIIPVLPDLIKDLTGLDNSQAAIYGGWMTFVYAVMQFFFMPILGNLSDRYGRRPVMLLSLFGLSLDYFIMALAPTVVFLFIGRGLAGVMGATFSTANAYIADISPPEKRAQNFGLVGAFFGVGFILGPVVGGILGEYGSRVPFYAAGIISLLNMVFGYFVLPETLTEDKRRPFDWKRANAFGVFRQIARLKGAFGLLTIMLLLATAHTAYPTSYAFSMNEGLGWTSRDVGISLGFFGIASIIVQGGLIRKIIPAIGLFWAAFIGITSNIIAFIGFGLATTGWVIYAMGPFSAFAGLYQPSLNNMISSRLSASEQGELQGAVGAVMGLALMFGPLPMTYLFKEFTRHDNALSIYLPGAPFIFGACLAVLALVLFLFVGKDSDLHTAPTIPDSAT
ncbi:MAG: TCR/Tet family MFS transporter [Maricaulaceae bacterium]